MHPWHDVELGPGAPELCKQVKVDRFLDRGEACHVIERAIDLDARRWGDRSARA